MNNVYWFLGKSLELLDTLIVLFWSVGWFLPRKWSRVALCHRFIVFAVATAQLVFWWRCPLVLMSEYLFTLAEPHRSTIDVFNPYTINTIKALFGVSFNTANIVLSGIIMGGAIIATIQVLTNRNKQHRT